MPYAVTRSGIVVPSRIDPAGRTGPTPAQARGPRWRSPAHGWHLPADVDGGQLDQRIVEAVVGTSTESAAATGWAALAWLGARWFTGVGAGGRSLDVPVAIGDRAVARRRPGVMVSQDWLFPGDVVVVDGLPITVPDRSVSWQARRARSLASAVCVIDMAAYSDLIDLETFADHVARLPARPGVRLLRRAVGLADENAWSPMEPPMRVLWELEGRHPKPLSNVPIFNLRGTHLFTPDLFDPIAGVAGEYNGAGHDGDAPRARDLDREELARRVGIETVSMVPKDIGQSGRFLRRLNGAYQRAAERRDEPRLWTLEQPGWWVDTSTVGARRGLTDEERVRWLRHRMP